MLSNLYKNFILRFLFVLIITLNFIPTKVHCNQKIALFGDSLMSGYGLEKKFHLSTILEKRLKENPPKYNNIHPSVLAKPDDSMLSFKKVRQWIKTQKEIASDCERQARRMSVDSKIKAQENAKAKYARAYIREMNHYLEHGDWVSNTYGEYQEKWTKWKITAGSREGQVI